MHPNHIWVVNQWCRRLTDKTYRLTVTFFIKCLTVCHLVFTCPAALDIDISRKEVYGYFYMSQKWKSSTLWKIVPSSTLVNYSWTVCIFNWNPARNRTTLRHLLNVISSLFAFSLKELTVDVFHKCFNLLYPDIADDFLMFIKHLFCVPFT